MSKKRKLLESAPVIEAPDFQDQISIHFPKPLVVIINEYARLRVKSFSSANDIFACLLDSGDVYASDGVGLHRFQKGEFDTLDNNLQSFHVVDIPMNSEVYFTHSDSKWYRNNYTINGLRRVIHFDGLYHMAIPGDEDTPREVIVQGASELFLSLDSVLALIGVEYWEINSSSREWRRLL